MDDGAVRIFQADRLQARVYPDRAALGRAAGEAAAARIREISARKPVSIIFAAAPSQNEFLETLAAAPGVDWSRVVAFHMDEYVGLRADAPQGFGNWLRARLFDRVKPGVVHTLRGEGDPEAECRRYAALLEASPPDLTCMGIGENGHLAFNDPPYAFFEDPQPVKVVELDPVSRRQQVNDGCFAAFEEVPKTAITLTIPTLLSAAWILCMVPGPRKAAAVRDALLGPVRESCPASVLRRKERAVLYLDLDSAAQADTALAGKGNP
jgi:glucosamine-6-phosphate deaminase